VAIAVVVVLALAGPANARIKIVKIYFGSPGPDTGSQRSLNHEWVQIHNYGSHSVNTGDWRIRDKSGHVFKFPHIDLAPGQDIRVPPVAEKTRLGIRSSFIGARAPTSGTTAAIPLLSNEQTGPWQTSARTPEQARSRSADIASEGPMAKNIDRVSMLIVVPRCFRRRTEPASRPRSRHTRPTSSRRAL
jgi:hypothetical protein